MSFSITTSRSTRALPLGLARANREAFAKWLEKFYQPGKAEQGIIRLTTPHAGKGLEADDVYLINPSMFPMADKIEQGGEEAFEELSVEYVAKTRAKDRMVFLPDLEVTSKKEVLGLFVTSRRCYLLTLRPSVPTPRPRARALRRPKRRARATPRGTRRLPRSSSH